MCKDSLAQYEHHYSKEVLKCHVNRCISIHSATVHSADQMLLLLQAKPAEVTIWKKKKKGGGVRGKERNVHEEQLKVKVSKDKL